MNKIAIVILCVITLVSCSEDRMDTLIELDTQLMDLVRSSADNSALDYYILPSETDLDNIPQDPQNKLTPIKVELGKLLYFETGLAMDAAKPSGMGTYSCATCHIPEAGFKPGSPQGIADGGKGFGYNGEMRSKNLDYAEEDMDVQSARPFSMVNVAYVHNTFWNGQFGSSHANEGTEEVWDNDEDTERNHLGMLGIETQNLEGIKSHRIAINKELLDKYNYTEMFDEAFPEVSVEERYTQNTASFALSAYIRTILSNKAPFQDWLKGDLDALGYKEKKGALLFFGKANCSKCHYEQNLGSLEFHALGVKDMYENPSFNTSEDDKRNLGRGGFTLREDDMFKFKVPGLYNVGDTDYFFHGASKTSLSDVIDYKVAAESENYNVASERLSKKFLPLDLDAEEKAHLISFLENSLRDPDLVRYKPTSILSGLCYPNNDSESKQDLGCD